MEYIVGILIVFGVIFFFVLYLLSWVRPYNIMRKKGYTLLQAYLYGLAIAMLGILAIVALNHFFENLPWKIHFFYIFLVTPITSLLGYFVLANYLSKLSVRKFGARKSNINWQLLGHLNIIAVLFFGVFMIIFSAYKFYWYGFDAGMKILSLLFKSLPGLTGSILTFELLQNLFSKPNIESRLIENERLPVLFIRSFEMDQAPFWVGNIKRNKIDDQLSNDLYAKKRAAIFEPFTFQQFFSYEFEKGIGPLIGLGNPNDYAPLESLTTSYYEDQNWQDMFSQWIHRAACIVNLPGRTAGLQFELKYILDHGLADRFFIFTKPVISKFHSKFSMPFFRWMNAAVLAALPRYRFYVLPKQKKFD